MASKKTLPMSLRISVELNARLNECAEALRIKKHTLAQDAIEAAVEAIEANDYKLVVPLEFRVSHVPARAASEEHETGEVAEAVADHLLKRNIVDVVKASSGEAEPVASDPGHTSEKVAPVSTAGQASAPGPKSPSRSGQTKASGPGAKRKRTRTGHKP